MRLPIWQLIRDAVQPLGREVAYAEIKRILWSQYPDLNDATINCQLIVCSVNQKSRIHYPENKKPRFSDGPYDFLYSVGRGRVVWYDPAVHGVWEILQDADGSLVVGRVDGDGAASTPALAEESEDSANGIFALESHLRDYLAKNLPKLTDHDEPLKLYVSPDGRDGVEFQTDVGPIDLLAVDSNGDYYVMELKVNRGVDQALGQILRYMGWIATRLANGKQVYGVIMAANISDKLKYAATQVPQVRLMEYRLAVTLQPVALGNEMVIGI